MNNQTFDNTLNDILVQMLQNLLNNKNLQESEKENLLLIIYNELMVNFSNIERKNLISVLLYNYFNFKTTNNNEKLNCSDNKKNKKQNESNKFFGELQEQLNDENMKEILDSFLVIRNK